VIGDGGGAYPDPLLRPITLNGHTSWRCPTCRTNGRADHRPGSEECREIGRERDLSVSS
jgi:hypothetical protein